MKADAATEKALLAAVHEFLETYRRRDADHLMTLAAPDADIILIGTGADERRVGPAEIRAQAKRDWSQSDTAMFDFNWNSVSAAGPVAWVAPKVLRVPSAPRHRAASPEPRQLPMPL